MAKASKRRLLLVRSGPTEWDLSARLQGQTDLPLAESYANAVKMEELGIPSRMLELNGAVSRPVAEQMPMGVREALKSDWALATTGIAGPDGGTPEKPVGTVWIAVAGPNGVESKLGSFPGSRELVIERASRSALNLLRRCLNTM